MCNRVQPEKHDMEIMLSVDALTPIYSDVMDVEPPHITHRHYGQPTCTIAKEKVVGSSPIARSNPRKRGFFNS